MKKWIPILLLITACKNMGQEKINITEVRPANAMEIEKDSTLSNNSVAIELFTKEDFQKVNKKMTFGFICVKNANDFSLSKTELDQRKLFFETIKLEKIKADHYKFFAEKQIFSQNDCYCRFERPGFVGVEGYKSAIFEIKLNPQK